MFSILYSIFLACLCIFGTAILVLATWIVASVLVRSIARAIKKGVKAMRKEFRDCKQCGKQFLVMNPQHIYCCTECYEEANKHKPLGFRIEGTKRPQYLTGSQEEAGRIAKKAKDAGMKYGDYVAKNKL